MFPDLYPFFTLLITNNAFPNMSFINLNTYISRMKFFNYHFKRQVKFDYQHTYLLFFVLTLHMQEYVWYKINKNFETKETVFGCLYICRFQCCMPNALSTLIFIARVWGTGKMETI